MNKNYSTETYAKWLIGQGVAEHEHVLVELGVLDKYPKKILKRNLLTSDRFLYKESYNTRQRVMSYYSIPDGYIVTY